MAVSYDQMSTDELVAENLRLSEQKEEIRARQLVINEEISKRATYESAARKLETMNDPEKEALVQMIKAEGIPSAEKVGEPGANGGVN